MELFALLHDRQRHHDGHDRRHGSRPTDFVAGLNGDWFKLEPTGFEMLVYACRHHSDGLMEGVVTVQTCWDADRLDLARVGIWPDPDRLCTEAARDPLFLERATERSPCGLGRVDPED